jgi:hypothetical protein
MHNAAILSVIMPSLITLLSINLAYYAQCHYAECHDERM